MSELQSQIRQKVDQLLASGDRLDWIAKEQELRGLLNQVYISRGFSWVSYRWVALPGFALDILKTFLTRRDKAEMEKVCSQWKTRKFFIQSIRELRFEIERKKKVRFCRISCQNTTHFYYTQNTNLMGFQGDDKYVIPQTSDIIYCAGVCFPFLYLSTGSLTHSCPQINCWDFTKNKFVSVLPLPEECFRLVVSETHLYCLQKGDKETYWTIYSLVNDPPQFKHLCNVNKIEMGISTIFRFKSAVIPNGNRVHEIAFTSSCIYLVLSSNYAYIFVMVYYLAQEMHLLGTLHSPRKGYFRGLSAFSQRATETVTLYLRSAQNYYMYEWNFSIFEPKTKISQKLKRKIGKTQSSPKEMLVL